MLRRVGGGGCCGVSVADDEMINTVEVNKLLTDVYLNDANVAAECLLAASDDPEACRMIVEWCRERGTDLAGALNRKLKRDNKIWRRLTR